MIVEEWKSRLFFHFFIIGSFLHGCFSAHSSTDHLSPSNGRMHAINEEGALINKFENSAINVDLLHKDQFSSCIDNDGIGSEMFKSNEKSEKILLKYIKEYFYNPFLKMPINLKSAALLNKAKEASQIKTILDGIMLDQNDPAISADSELSSGPTELYYLCVEFIDKEFLGTRSQEIYVKILASLRPIDGCLLMSDGLLKNAKNFPWIYSASFQSTSASTPVPLPFLLQEKMTRFVFDGENVSFYPEIIRVFLQNFPSTDREIEFRGELEAFYFLKMLEGADLIGKIHIKVTIPNNREFTEYVSGTLLMQSSRLNEQLEDKRTDTDYPMEKTNKNKPLTNFQIAIGNLYTCSFIKSLLTTHADFSLSINYNGLSFIFNWIKEYNLYYGLELPNVTLRGQVIKEQDFFVFELDGFSALKLTIYTCDICISKNVIDDNCLIAASLLDIAAKAFYFKSFSLTVRVTTTDDVGKLKLIHDFLSLKIYSKIAKQSRLISLNYIIEPSQTDMQWLLDDLEKFFQKEKITFTLVSFKFINADSTRSSHVPTTADNQLAWVFSRDYVIYYENVINDVLICVEKLGELKEEICVQLTINDQSSNIDHLSQLIDNIENGISSNKKRLISLSIIDYNRKKRTLKDRYNWIDMIIYYRRAFLSQAEYLTLEIRDYRRLFCVEYLETVVESSSLSIPKNQSIFSLHLKIAGMDGGVKSSPLTHQRYYFFPFGHLFFNFLPAFPSLDTLVLDFLDNDNVTFTDDDCNLLSVGLYSYINKCKLRCLTLKFPINSLISLELKVAREITRSFPNLVDLEFTLGDGKHHQDLIAIFTGGLLLLNRLVLYGYETFNNYNNLITHYQL